MKGDIHKKIEGRFLYKGKTLTCHKKTGYTGLFFYNKDKKSYIKTYNCFKEIDIMMFECVKYYDILCLKEILKRGADIKKMNLHNQSELQENRKQNILNYAVSTIYEEEEEVSQEHIIFLNKLLDLVVSTIKSKKEIKKFINNVPTRGQSIMSYMFARTKFGDEYGNFTSNEKKFLKNMIKHGYDVSKGAVFYSVFLPLNKFKWVIKNIFTEKQLRADSQLKEGINVLFEDYTEDYDQNILNHWEVMAPYVLNLPSKIASKKILKNINVPNRKGGRLPPELEGIIKSFM
jgi:hypothetical protein